MALKIPFHEQVKFDHRNPFGRQMQVMSMDEAKLIFKLQEQTNCPAGLIQCPIFHNNQHQLLQRTGQDTLQGTVI